jgi:hypothetical protein
LATQWPNERRRVTAAEQEEQIMNARFRIAAPVAIAVACAAIVLSASPSKAGGPPAGAFALSDGNWDLIPRMENSTFPPPPRASETSPWTGKR